MAIVKMNKFTLVTFESHKKELLRKLQGFSKVEFINLQDEEKLVEKVANMIKAKTKNGCTGCRYCMPCPFGIDIPGNFKLWNEYGMLGLKDTAKRRYTNLGDAQAEFCKKCGKCEKLCPQSIKIREDLQRVVQDIKNL